MALTIKTITIENELTGEKFPAGWKRITRHLESRFWEAMTETEESLERSLFFLLLVLLHNDGRGNANPNADTRGSRRFHGNRDPPICRCRQFKGGGGGSGLRGPNGGPGRSRVTPGPGCQLALATDRVRGGGGQRCVRIFKVQCVKLCHLVARF